MIIEQYSYSNGLAKIHPVEKLGFALSMMAVCLSARSPWIGAGVVVLMALLLTMAARIPLGLYLKLLSLPLAFLLTSVAAILAEVHFDRGLLHAVSFSFERTGFILLLMSRSFGAVSCLYFISLTTPLTAILWSLSKMKLPDFLADITSLIYRFIFLFLDISARIYRSQDSRLGFHTLRASYRSLGSLVSALFIRAFMQAEQTYTALEARGYNGTLAVLQEEYRYSAAVITLSGVLVLFAVAMEAYLWR